MTLRHFVPNLGTGSCKKSEIYTMPRHNVHSPLLDHKSLPVLTHPRDLEVEPMAHINFGDVLADLVVAHAADCHSSIYYRQKNLPVRNGRVSGSTAEVRPAAPDC